MKSVSISTRQGRCWIPALALALALGLSGCGGGDGAAVGTNDGAKKFAVAAIAKVEADQANVVAVSQVSEKRITRTVFEYVFNVTVLNGALPQTDVQATVASVGSGTAVIDGVVVVGSMAANAQVTSADTITLRHDRTYPFDLAKLTWRVSGTVPLTAQPITVRGVVPERVTTLSTGEKVVMSDLLVVLDESVSVTAATTLFAQLGGTIVGRIPEAHLYQVEVLQANTEAKLRAVRAALASRSEVLEVSFNGITKTSGLFSASPSTVYYPKDQYVLVQNDQNFIKQTPNGYQRPVLDAMNAGNAWKTLQTIPLTTVTVGVIDGGFTNANVSELKFERLYGPTAEDTSFTPVEDGINNINHGMIVAGIIGAKGETSVTTSGNVAGLAWQVPMKLHGARTDFSNAVRLAHVANLVRGGAKVINASLGSDRLTLPSVCSEASVQARLISTLAKHYGEFIYVLAAGNEYDKDYLHQPLALLFQPEKTPTCPLFAGAKAMTGTDLTIVKNHIIIVANADARLRGREVLYSGPDGSNFGLGVEIAAPGVNILSLGFSIEYWEKPYKGATGGATGTSMSAPQVAAALAVAWSIKPTLSADQAKQIVIGDVAPSSTARRMISDPEGRNYPLLDLDDVVNKALAATGQSRPPVDPTALAPLVIYATCKYILLDEPPFLVPASPRPIKLNLRITTGAGLAISDEGLIDGSYATALPSGSYTLALQEPTGSLFAWNNQSATKYLPFTLAEDPSGNVRTMHVQFSAATSSACNDTGNLLPPTVTGVGVVPIATTTIDIPASSFARVSNVALSTNGYGADTLLNAPPYGDVANAAEWEFNVPVAGTYELFAEYAAAESRPVNIAFNGTVKFTNALATVTGGWFPANRQTISQGVVALPAGAITMRVSRSSVFPHIRGFKLVPVASLINPANGHRYEVITCGTWTQCDAAARAKGGNLVTIRSAAENAWLVANIFPISNNEGAIWMGATDEGTEGVWRWRSGEAFLYSNWNTGEPNNYQGIENSGVLYKSAGPSGTWNDVPDAAAPTVTQAIVEYSLSGTFSVAANSPSGSLFTAPTGASSCAFTATGSWSYGTGSFTSADGRPGFASAAYPALLPSTPYFSLIANTAGGYRAISSSRTLPVSSGQSLYFQINEGIGIGDSYADNSGALSVSYQCQ